jgi:hypothetical protein
MVTRKTPAVRIAFAAAFLVLALAVVPVALAGKGKPGGGGGTTSSSSLSLVLLNSTDGLVHYGQQVTFNLSTTATSNPYVSVTCSQNGSLVYSASAGFFASYPWPWNQVFTLSSMSWTSGAADCTGKLYYYLGNGKFSTLATTSFHVYA